MSSLLGGSLVVEITPNVVKRYQADRLKEKAGPKTINDEVQLLLRLCGEQGALIRATLRRDKALKLPLPPSPGRPYSTEEKARMLEEAQKLRTPMMCAALALDLNTGLRDKELRQIRWDQIDLVHKKALTVGKSKTEAGTGRVILGIFNDGSVVSNLSHYPFGRISLPFQEVFPHGQSVRIKQPGFVMRHQFELRRATPRLLGADQHSQELGPAGLPRLARQPLLNDPP